MTQVNLRNRCPICKENFHAGDMVFLVTVLEEGWGFDVGWVGLLCVDCAFEVSDGTHYHAALKYLGGIG